MNIKSLLLGSAAAAVAFSGAQAADAIIIAEPEPMEYVRICDTYGTGFFYIPGTETCLKIGGYVRYQMEYSDSDAWTDDRFGKLARFAPTFDARNATEWGTLRSFAELEFNWTSGAGAITGGSGNSTNLAHAYISLENGAGTFLIGKTDTPYHAASNGGLNAGGIWGGVRGNNATDITNSGTGATATNPFGVGNATSTGVVSYQFNAGNGLTATFAAVENTGNTDFEPNLEAVVRYSQGWGVIVGALGYDNEVSEWGGKLGAEVRFNPVTVGLQVAYGSDFNSAYGARYADGAFSVAELATLAGVPLPTALGVAAWAPTSEWAVLGYVRADLTQQLAAKASLQWFEGFSNLGIGDAYQVTAGLDWRPVSGLQIIPEVRYTKVDLDGAPDPDRFDFGLRFNRSF